MTLDRVGNFPATEVSSCFLANRRPAVCVLDCRLQLNLMTNLRVYLTASRSVGLQNNYQHFQVFLFRDLDYLVVWDKFWKTLTMLQPGVLELVYCNTNQKDVKAGLIAGEVTARGQKAKDW